MYLLKTNHLILKTNKNCVLIVYKDVKDKYGQVIV